MLRNVASVARNGLRVLGAPVNPTSLVASAEEHLRGRGRREWWYGEGAWFLGTRLRSGVGQNVEEGRCLGQKMAPAKEQRL